MSRSEYSANEALAMMPNPVQRKAARRPARESINWSNVWLAVCAVALVAVVISQAV